MTLFIEKQGRTLNDENKSHCLGTEDMPGIKRAAASTPKRLKITPIPMDKKPYLVKN